MLRIVIALVPVVVGVVALRFRHSRAARFSAVAATLLSVSTTLGVLLAPHRVAEELVHQRPQSAEWQRGARDTRDAIQGILPALGTSLVVLAILAAIPLYRKAQDGS